MMSPSAVQGANPRATAEKGLSFLRGILYCFRSVHLAIVLLSLLAISTIIGVVMPQEGMVELAQIKAQYGTNFTFLQAMGFFNVYSSFWFLTLEVLFFFNLLIGSFKWLKPATLAAVQKTCLPESLIVHRPEVFSLATLATESRSGLEDRLKAALKPFHYRVHADGSGNLYACKGNLTRLGPSAAHVGILLCLLAGVYGSFTGFKAVKMAVPGEAFAIPEANTFKTNVAPSLWLGSVPEWKIHIRDFKIDYYPERPGMAKQYYSTLEIRSPQGELLRQQTISVNHPLLYDNISIYQASFAPTGRFQLAINGAPMTAEVNNQFNDRPISLTPMKDGSTLVMFPFFAQQDPGVTQNYAVFFVRRPGEPFAQDGKMPENLRLNEGESGTLKGYRIAYRQPEMSTGLQIKRAPEVPWMYLSYLIISVGTVLCFFSQRQIWIALKEVSPGKTQVLLCPKTNKARLSFRKELIQLQAALNLLVSQPSTPKGSPS